MSTDELIDELQARIQALEMALAEAQASVREHAAIAHALGERVLARGPLHVQPRDEEGR